MKSSIHLIVRSTLLFWLIEKTISWKLWVANRSFPLVPLLTLSPIVHVFLFALFVVIAVLLLIKPTNRHFLFFIIATEVLYMASDQLRWQPWQYQFLFIIFAVLINLKNEKGAINSVAFIIAATYFYSGLQKWNTGFLYNVWTNLILIRFFHVPAAIAKTAVMQYSGLAIPSFEMIAGAALLFIKNNKPVAWLLIAMHGFILLLLGPFGLNYNRIVWPWNIVMMILLYFLFIKSSSFQFKPRSLLYRWNIVIVIMIGILPIAGLLGYWDTYFSFGLYSGKTVYPKIYVTQSDLIPPELKPYVTYSKKGHNGLHESININSWSLGELNVPIPPEQRIFKSIYQSFTDRYPQLQSVIVYYQ